LLVLDDVGLGAVLLVFGAEDDVPPFVDPDVLVDPDLSTAVGAPGLAGGT